MLYASVMTALPVVFWLLWRQRGILLCAGLTLGVCALWALAAAYGVLNTVSRAKGVRPLYWGGLSFAVALVISLIKGGVMQRVWRALGLSAQSVAAASQDDRLDE